MRCSMWLVALCGACSAVGGAPEAAAPGSFVEPGPAALAHELAGDDLVRADVRGTVASIEHVAALVEAMDPEARAAASESLRLLSVSCPYTRAALQLPFALKAVVVGVEVDRLDPFVQRDWAYLQRGLTAHVAVLEALGVDLAAPGPSDPLHVAQPGLMVDRDTLLASADPLVVTAPLIGAFTALAEQLDEPTRRRIELHSDRVETATGIVRPCPRGPWAEFPGQPWTLGMHLGGWHDALRRVQPFVGDPEVAERIAAMIDLLDAHGAASLASAVPAG